MTDEYLDTGPFCRHWSDPGDCERVCKRCGHRCGAHYWGEGDNECGQEDCNCPEWEES